MAALRALFPGADLPQHFREDIERGLLRPSFAQEWYRPLDRPWIDADRAAAFPERTLASTIVARRRDGSTDQAIRSLEYLLTIVEHPRTNASTYEEASRLLGVIIREWRQPKELFHRARAWLARRR